MCSQEYVHFLDSLASVRAQTLALLIDVLKGGDPADPSDPSPLSPPSRLRYRPSQFAHLTVVNKRWYDPVDEIKLYVSGAVDASGTAVSRKSLFCPCVCVV